MRDKVLMRQFARATCDGYCAGCTTNCEQAADGLPVGDVMRSLMYYHNYGEPALASQALGTLGGDALGRLSSIDLGPAAKKCPNHLPIGEMVAQAVRLMSLPAYLTSFDEHGASEA
jgi:hypothetical protein